MRLDNRFVRKIKNIEEYNSLIASNDEVIGLA